MIHFIFVPNKARKRRADVPSRIRRSVVQIRVQRAIKKPIVRVTANHRRHIMNPYINYLGETNVSPLASQFTLSSKWFTRKRRADAPSRTRRSDVQSRGQRATKKPTVRATANHRIIFLRILKP